MLALCALAAPLGAQETAGPWRLSYFPYVTVSPNDGLMGIARAIWFRQAPWGERITLANAVAVEAGYSTRDAWLGRITWTNPRLGERNRIVAHAEAGQEPRFGDPDAPVVRDRVLGWVDASRQLQGPLYAAVRLGLRYDQIGAGPVAVDDQDLTVRGALVLDLRDREFETNRGALIEGGAIYGSGGEGYGALYAQLRGWYNPLPYLRVTGRYAWRQPTVNRSLASVHEFPAWEDGFTVVGGQHSHRGFGTGQFDWAGYALAGAEVRFDVLNLGELGAFSVLAFADGAKELVPENHDLIIDEPCWPGPCYGDGQSGRDWQWGFGGGVALRVLRAATLTVTASGGDGETRWYIGSGWSW